MSDVLAPTTPPPGSSSPHNRSRSCSEADSPNGSIAQHNSYYHHNLYPPLPLALSVPLPHTPPRNYHKQQDTPSSTATSSTTALQHCSPASSARSFLSEAYSMQSSPQSDASSRCRQPQHDDDDYRMNERIKGTSLKEELGNEINPIITDPTRNVSAAVVDSSNSNNNNNNNNSYNRLVGQITPLRVKFTNILPLFKQGSDLEPLRALSLNSPDSSSNESTSSADRFSTILASPDVVW